MVRVQLRWTERTGRDLQTLDGADVRRSYTAVQSDPAVQGACAVIAETLQVTGEGEFEPDPMFRLVIAVLEALARPEPTLAVVRYFEAWFLRLHGVAPDPDHCASCHRPVAERVRLALADGGPRCGECSRQTELARVALTDADRRFLRFAWGHPPRGLDDYAGTCRPGDALEFFLRGATEHYSERSVRSYRYLNQMIQSRASAPGEPGA
jgi:DNA repair protein RecO